MVTEPNHEAIFWWWDDFCEYLRDIFSSTDRQNHALGLLEARVEKGNRSVTVCTEDMARLFRRAYPDIYEPKKLWCLMHVWKEQLFAERARNQTTPYKSLIIINNFRNKFCK